MNKAKVKSPCGSDILVEGGILISKLCLHIRWRKDMLMICYNMLNDGEC